MATLFMSISFALLVMETLLGTLANGFIVLVNYISWFQSRKLSPNDLILTCLGLSRLAWQTVVILDEILDIVSLSGPSGNVNLTISVLWIFISSTNIWFATWLSVFYFAKIAVFSHPVFLHVKQRISGLVPWLLLGSAVLSAGMTILLVASFRNDLPKCDFYSSPLRINDSEIPVPDSCGYFDILANLPNVIPLLIFLASSILLIISLGKHVRCLQHNGTSIQDFNTQVHWTAIKALASFSVLYLFSFVALIVQGILIWKNKGSSQLMVLVDNAAAVYPAGHAIILIFLNPKLKEAWVQMLRHFKCCRREAPQKHVRRGKPVLQEGH
ncbi:taste receptor type 2 member 3-like [Paroedura picta]|uniref:taste receptor type 2 member 3-like n=1 Tax=Paroedura picta TaxID=143630 RepID=UPI0040567B90